MADPEADTPLTQLCSICHAVPPKYRCPRCNTRTCSLPCARRHKLWSSCNGVRDPSSYVRRSDLLTPSGVDRDFNFISGIERGIERAGTDIEQRGMEFGAEEEDGSAWKKRARVYEKGEKNLEDALQNREINLKRLPKGMGRRKNNKTMWVKRLKCLSWTIEWIVADSKPTLSSSLELSKIEEAFSTYMKKEDGKGIEPRGMKRKLNEDHKHQSTGLSPRSSSIETFTTSDQDQPSSSASLQPSNPLPPPSTKPETPIQPPTTTPPSPSPSTFAPITPPLSTPLHHFYLHRPLVPSKPKVLIPLSPTTTLSASLQSRTLLEFPTIYVLPYPPSSLPSEHYIMEEEFWRLRGVEERGEKIKLVGEEGVGADGVDGNELGHDINVDVDHIKVLEVLKKDLCV
ncbi:MAG: hypothetical protein M1834_001603 [Cirrosporium novae-zelandiae]|nr:MAG: hypothetical protein M1834_004120 [Cirrosporium novae-zelandiae]KAI9735587.1 MAG: hypothetical protein M1834_001603 [Cirrosporium novae-zelandiae]